MFSIRAWYGPRKQFQLWFASLKRGWEPLHNSAYMFPGTFKASLYNWEVLRKRLQICSYKAEVARLFPSRDIIWKLFFISGCTFWNNWWKVTISGMQTNFCSFWYFYWQFLTKYLVVEDLCCFFSCQKKVQGPRKEVGGPHFGHVWSKSMSHSVCEIRKSIHVQWS